ncbi:hypothetical protein GQ473_02745 [archaeon]|nr:hypothetical protein [archaeon]
MIVEQILPLIVIFLIGYFFKLKNILAKKDSEIFGKLLMYLVIPAIIIDSFSKMVIDRSLIYLPIAGLITVMSLTVFGFLFARILGLEKKIKGAFVTTFPTLEGGNIGYPFMFLIFGATGLSYVILFDIANAFWLFTVVYFISGRMGGNNTQIKSALNDLVRAPIIWAIVIGLFLNVIGFSNVLFSNILESIGGGLLLLVMLMLGLEFEPKIKSIKLPFVEIIIKTIVGFGIAVGLSSLFGFVGLTRIVFILWATLPPSVVTLVFAQENKLDTKYIANLLSIAIPIWFVFVSVIIGYF